MAYSEPLRIRAWLRAPVIADAWLPLDGALLYQHTRQELGAQVSSLPGASLIEQPKGEPLKGGRLPMTIVHAKDWYYRCSWAVWGAHIDGQDHWSKRFDQSYAGLVHFGGRRGKVDTSAGAYRAYHMPVYYRSALWVEWYCVGQRGELEPLIHSITHLGKKVSQGWGRVMRWEIQTIREDWSIMREGRLTRGVPIYHLPEGCERKMGNYGIRPPYWDWRNQMELVMP